MAVSKIFQHSHLIAGALIVSGCVTGTPVPVQTVHQSEPINIPLGTKLAPIKLDRVSFKIRRGTAIGAYVLSRFAMADKFCIQNAENVFWNKGRVRTRDIELQDLFHEAFTEAGYKVVGNPDKMFSESVRDKIDPDYLIGAQVTNIAMEICDHGSRWDGRYLNTQSGKGSMQVRWQVFSRLKEKVVFDGKTDGFGEIKDPVATGEISIITESFANAAKNFAANRQLLALLSSPEPTLTDIRSIDAAVLKIPRQKISRNAITNDIDLIRRSVVTIDGGAGGFGSGFFISPRLIMTNHHVVGGNAVKRITLVTGRKILGEVIRKHPERDIAIIQVEDGGHRPLPIRFEPVKITEDVFAIGTPQDRKLKGTVSKGIVSSYRSNKFGLEDIQADVDIHGGNSGGALLDKHGNVVGVAYAGINGGKKLSSGLNFFVPINDAIQKLNIGFKDK